MRRARGAASVCRLSSSETLWSTLAPMEQYPGAATSLDEALDKFDWRNEPRMGPEALNLYYQRRTSHRRLETVLTQLRGAVSKGTYLRALYLGPAGCGKSTDLTWVTQQVADDPDLSEPLMVFHYDIGESVGKHDVGFSELALSLVLKIHERFGPGQDLLSLDPSHLEKVREWLYGSEKDTHRKKKLRCRGGWAWSCSRG